MECTKTAYDRIEAFVIERHLLTIRLNEIDCGKALTGHADHLGCKIHRHNIGSAVGKPLPRCPVPDAISSTLVLVRMPGYR
jgi:hypothetical protein